MTLAGGEKITHLVALDWNGTLLADARIIFACTNHILQVMGYDTIDFATYRNAYDIPIDRFYANIGVGADVFHTRTDITYTLFHDTYESMAQSARLRRGARELLGLLKKRGMHAVVLSNHNVPDIERHIERLGLDGAITAVLAHEERSMKTRRRRKAELLSDFIAHHRIAPENVMVVGDSHEETQIAHDLSLTGVAITDGHVSTPRLKAAKPHYLINHLREMESVMDAHGFGGVR
ncbi:MAG: HAD hydrolase-like protein [Alphaproteobacteria bacterium]|nr:HAD hydrolase-like protein [Alphaproteobacteria bacterium]